MSPSYLHRERVIFHRARHVAPPRFYCSPEWTNQTLTGECLSCFYAEVAAIVGSLIRLERQGWAEGYSVGCNLQPCRLHTGPLNEVGVQILILTCFFFIGINYWFIYRTMCLIMFSVFSVFFYSSLVSFVAAEAVARYQWPFNRTVWIAVTVIFWLRGHCEHNWAAVYRKQITTHHCLWVNTVK